MKCKTLKHVLIDTASLTSYSFTEKARESSEGMWPSVAIIAFSHFYADASLCMCAHLMFVLVCSFGHSVYNITLCPEVCGVACGSVTFCPPSFIFD